PGGDLGLQLRRIRPAKPRGVAVGAERRIGRWVDAVGTGVPGMEHLPAALAGRRFLGATRADRSPVDRLEVDIHPEALEEIGRDVAERLGDRLVLRHQAGNRRTGIAALTEEPLGRFEVARSFEYLATLFVVERRARREIAG